MMKLMIIMKKKNKKRQIINILKMVKTSIRNHILVIGKPFEISIQIIFEAQLVLHITVCTRPYKYTN